MSAAKLRRDKDLVVAPLGAQPLVLVSHDPGPHPERDELSVSDLTGCRLITSHPGSLMRQLVEDVLADQPETTIACEVDHRTMILPLVAAGAGEAILPDSWREPAIRSGLRVRPLTDSPRMWSAAICRPTGLTPLATVFLETISRVIEHS